MMRDQPDQLTYKGVISTPLCNEDERPAPDDSIAPGVLLMLDERRRALLDASLPPKESPMDKVFQMVVTTNEELAKPTISRELMIQTVQREMHRKVLLRAAELVAMGWTRSVGARNELGQKVVATDSQAVSWCLNGAINRALLDVLGLDWYACRLDLGLWMTLRRPVRAVLRERSLSTSLGSWNDLATQEVVEDVLRAAAARLSTP